MAHIENPKHEVTIVYPELQFVVTYSYLYNIIMNVVTTVEFKVYGIESIDEETEKVNCYNGVFAIGEILCTGSMLFKNNLCFDGYKKINTFVQLLTEMYYKVEEICKVDNFIKDNINGVTTSTN